VYSTEPYHRFHVKAACPSRKCVQVDILDLFRRGRQFGIPAHPCFRREFTSMKTIVSALLTFLTLLFRFRVALQLEIVALRHQLAVYQRTTLRPRTQPADRLFWSCLSRWLSGWRSALVFVQPGTATTWQRKRFRAHWAELSQQGRPGVSEEIRALICKISAANTDRG
jgi:hypothetical protein